jgi:ABC-2 type transport system ATP-binding protein
MSDVTSVPAIETHDLTKRYGGSGNARGIFSVDLRVEQGEIFGFLGPNGAGKTTTIRTLLDFIRPTAGWARIFGLDCHRESVEIHRRTGNLPGELALYPNMTGKQLLDYSAHLRGGVSSAEIARLAGRLDIDLSRPLKAYSRGNKQKIGLIQAMMHKPDLLILDEPTGGLDPLVQQSLYELLEEVKREGRTIFFSSHILPEVERLCDRVAIIREGRLVSVETVAGFKEKALRRMDIVFDSPVSPEPFAAIPGVVEAHGAGTTLHFAVKGSLNALVKAVAQHTVVNIVTYEPSLEEIFLGFYKDNNPASSRASAEEMVEQ